MLLGIGFASAQSLGPVTLEFFLTSDCPISKRLAPEIGRICREYAGRGVSCTLVFVQDGLTAERARAFERDFSLAGIPFVLDARHERVMRAGATVTPEAALFDGRNELRYLGRIDDSHTSWTESRPARRRDLREALDAVLSGKPAPQARTKAIGCYITPLTRGATP